MLLPFASGGWSQEAVKGEYFVEISSSLVYPNITKGARQVTGADAVDEFAKHENFENRPGCI